MEDQLLNATMSTTDGMEQVEPVPTQPTIGDSLRELAQWYDEHPEVPLAYEFGAYSTGIRIFSLGSEPLATLAQIAKAMGTCKKSSDETFYRISRQFGLIKFEAVAYHEEIGCTKRTVEKVVKKMVPTKFAKVEKFDPVEFEEQEVAETSEVWDCPDSLLAALDERELKAQAVEESATVGEGN